MLKSALVSLAAATALASPAAAFSPGVARAVGPCTAQQICSFTAPEDIADLAGTPWLMINQQDEHNADVGLAAMNVDTGEIIRFARTKLGPLCEGNPKGGAVGLRKEGAGWRMVRIVHPEGGYGAPAPDAVETFRVTMARGRPTLALTGCVAAPPELVLNDIAALPDGFAATHVYDRAMSRQEREARFLASKPTGYVVRWTKAKGWAKIPNSDGSFPNGVDASPDGRWLAFAETYGHVLNRIRPDGTGRQRIAIDMNPDNDTALADGRFVVAGGTGEPMVSTRGCGPLSAKGCGFPAAAKVVDFAKGTVTTLVTSGGDSTPGFSVAVLKAGRVYIGASTGNRITMVPAGKTAAVLP